MIWPVFRGRQKQQPQPESISICFSIGIVNVYINGTFVFMKIHKKILLESADAYTCLQKRFHISGENVGYSEDIALKK